MYQNRQTGMNALFAGFKNDSSDEDGEVRESQQNITDPEKMRVDLLLTNKQLEIFLNHVSLATFKFNKIWLNKFNLVANKHYGIISKSQGLFKAYKSVIFVILQDIYVLIAQERDNAAAILEIISELYYRKEFQPYQQIIDEYRVDLHKDRLIKEVEDMRKDAIAIRRTEGNRKKSKKLIENRKKNIEKISQIDPFDDVKIPQKRERDSSKDEKDIGDVKQNPQEDLDAYNLMNFADN